MPDTKKFMDDPKKLASLEIAWARLCEHHEALIKADAPEHILLDYIEAKCHVHAVLEDLRERSRA